MHAGADDGAYTTWDALPRSPARVGLPNMAIPAATSSPRRGMAHPGRAHLHRRFQRSARRLHKKGQRRPLGRGRTDPPVSGSVRRPLCATLGHVLESIRAMRQGEEAAVHALDVLTWGPHVTPAPRPPARLTTGRAQRLAGDRVLVAATASEHVMGYARLARSVPLASNGHVLEFAGLAVDPSSQGRGLGRALVLAAVDLARDVGARKLTLRVLATNPHARRLYESNGFTTEGVLRGEFHVQGRDVDDVLMARQLHGPS
jgi:ribosomal protein S18 acetylase RimI-like enzyme